jgi:hypothetical protein
MTPVTRRRLSRLEKLVTAERRQREPLELAWQRQAARDHAAKLVALILHGDPEIEEPLAIAWDRALDYLGLKEVHQAHLPDRLRAAVLATLPGDTENAKFAGVFYSAPSWLLSFCMARLDGFVLGFELPKDSEPALRCGRDGLREMRSWPDLPSGTIGAGCPMPEPNPFRALDVEEVIDLIELFGRDEEIWSRQDRRRHEEVMTKVDSDELSRALTKLIRRDAESFSVKS